MGLAKYFEDNMEIAQNRLYMKYHGTVEAEIESAVSFTVLPQIVVQIASESVGVDQKKQDVHIVCKDCGCKFIFSAKNQDYYKLQQWSHPKRCKACRELRKLRRLLYSAS